MGEILIIQYKVGVIYLRTNLVNGKQYVGQTKDFKQREYSWNCLKQVYANPYLTKARNKYGLENFDTVILGEFESQEELNRWEKHYIKMFNSLFPNGYNFQEGGTNGCGCAETTKEKISIANTGKEPWNKGKTYDELFDEETAKRLRKLTSDFAKTRTGEKNPFYGHHFDVHPMQGKHHSDATKRKIGDKNRNGKKAIPVVLVKDNGDVINYLGMREAHRNGYDSGSISRAVRGFYKTCGHHYRDGYWYTKEEYEKMLAE